MLDWIPDQVRDDKMKQASGILVRRVYGGLVCLLPASGWFTSLWMVYQPLDGLPAFGWLANWNNVIKDLSE